VPRSAGEARIRIEVKGLDGTVVADSAPLEVVNAAPTVRLVKTPTRAEVGKAVHVTFKVTGGRSEQVDVSTRSGIVFSRAFLIRQGTGEFAWTPTSSGSADILIRVRGHQGQTASASLRLTVAPRPPPVTPPTVTLLKVPQHAVVGRESIVAFQAVDCAVATARIEARGAVTKVWRFPCTAPRAQFSWTPAKPGQYTLSVTGRGDETTARATTRLIVGGSR